MPSAANTDHPFAPAPTPAPEQLKAYLAGQLNGAEAHAVERALEEDPLLQEALQGFAESGAQEGFERLEQHRPSGPMRLGFGRLFTLAVLVVIILIGGIWLMVPPLLQTPVAQPLSPLEGTATTASTTNNAPLPAPIDVEEIAAAVEQPESLRIGHAALTHQASEPSPKIPIERETGVQPIALVDPPRSAAQAPRERPERARRESRQMQYLHDLKLVHPKELYPNGPGIDPARLGVPAQYADRGNERQGTEQQRLQNYMDFMDAALYKFKQNDHKGCLEDLAFLLEQHPEDVNALFYAGLCSHNLALYGRARSYLHRAAMHPIDSFYEEATWYHALTLDRMGETDAAQEAYARIVAENGFYSERARSRQHQP